MLTCTPLRQGLLQWPKKKGVHPKASKSKLKADRPDRWNDFNFKNVAGNNTTSHTVTGRTLLTSPGVADTYIFLMNTCNSLPDSYQQRVIKNTLAKVKWQIE
jgi:hypothetical protein